MEIIFKTWIRKHVEGTQEYKDHVYIRNAIWLQRNEFTSWGFSLYQFFFIETDTVAAVLLNLSICMLIASNTRNTKWISHFYHFYPHSTETKELIQI